VIGVLPKDTMTLQEASRYLSMDEQTVSRLAAERRIPALEQDGQWVFSKKSIDKWRTLQESRKR
jgi:excisionase family DNA binding protein